MRSQEPYVNKSGDKIGFTIIVIFILLALSFGANIYATKLMLAKYAEENATNIVRDRDVIVAELNSVQDIIGNAAQSSDVELTEEQINEISTKVLDQLYSNGFINDQVRNSIYNPDGTLNYELQNAIQMSIQNQGMMSDGMENGMDGELYEEDNMGQHVNLDALEGNIEPESIDTEELDVTPKKGNN